MGILAASLLATFAYLMYRKKRTEKTGKHGFIEFHSEERLPYQPEVHNDGQRIAGELDVTHFEMTDPDAPRHELR